MASSLYLATNPDFPPSRPFGYPHLVRPGLDPQGYSNPSNPSLHIADGVATLLYNYRPEALSALLDLRRPSFRFTHSRHVEGDLRQGRHPGIYRGEEDEIDEEKEEEACYCWNPDLMVKREGDVVAVCFSLWSGQVNRVTVVE